MDRKRGKVQYWQLFDIPSPISSYCFYKDTCPGISRGFPTPLLPRPPYQYPQTKGKATEKKDFYQTLNWHFKCERNSYVGV